jgi:phage shock protein A
MKQPKKPGLKESVAELEEENTRLKARIVELEARVAELEAARDAATDAPPSEGIIVLE